MPAPSGHGTSCFPLGSFCIAFFRLASGLPGSCGFSHLCFSLQCFCIFCTCRAIYGHSWHLRPSFLGGARYGTRSIVGGGKQSPCRSAWLRLASGKSAAFLTMLRRSVAVISWCRFTRCEDTSLTRTANVHSRQISVLYICRNVNGPTAISLSILATMNRDWRLPTIQSQMHNPIQLELSSTRIASKYYIRKGRAIARAVRAKCRNGSL